MFFINICYTVITYRIKDRMEAVPVLILERRPVIRNGGIEVGMDRTKILVVDDESRMRKLVKDFLQKQLRCGGGRRRKRGAGYFF